MQSDFTGMAIGSMVMMVKVIPFGTKDNGGDLVKLHFFTRLLTVRNYLKGLQGKALATKADALGKEQ
jgi:hypothetical protein